MNPGFRLGKCNAFYTVCICFNVAFQSFAPNNKYVVSVGSQHDIIVNVWDWRSGVKVASNKVSTKVKAISFAENGNYFVTAGNRYTFDEALLLKLL